MKQKIAALLLSAAVLALAGCGNIGVIGGPDGSTTVIFGDTEITIGGEDAPSTGGESREDLEEPDSGSCLDNPDASDGEDSGTTSGSEDPYPEAAPELDEAGTYNSAEDVGLYLHLYGHLPDNYITKSEARDLGWTGGSVERYAPGCAIGGDRFGNREGLLPSKDGRTYYECDTGTIGEASRGAERIIFSNDGLIYYTEDHYESFTLLYGEE